MFKIKFTQLQMQSSFISQTGNLFQISEKKNNGVTSLKPFWRHFLKSVMLKI